MSEDAAPVISSEAVLDDALAQLKANARQQTDGVWLKNLNETGVGTLPNGWGEASHWPPERITAGDWTSAMWRSPALADSSAIYTSDAVLRRLSSVGLSGHSTGREPSRYWTAKASTSSRQ